MNYVSPKLKPARPKYYNMRAETISFRSTARSFLPKKSALTGRTARRSAALLISFVFIYELFMPAMFVVTHSGVVSAELVRIRAPTDGYIKDLHITMGQPVKAGENLGAIETDSQWGIVPKLRREVSRLAEECEAYRLERDAIIDFERTLHARSDQFRKLLVQFDANLYQSEIFSSNAYGEQTKKLSSNVSRETELSRENLHSKVSRDLTASQWAIAKGNADSSRFEAAARAIRVEGAHDGFLLDTGTNGTSYFLQKADEIKLRLADLDLSLHLSEAQLNAATEDLREQISQNHHKLTAATDGVIWQQYATRNQSVKAGQSIIEIADTDSTFIIGLISEQDIHKIEVGDQVNIKIDHFSRPLHGQLGGYIINPVDGQGSAVMPNKDINKNTYLYVKILDLDKSQANSLIGRSATLVIPGHRWSWLSNFFAKTYLF